uniref:Phosvitin n=1 Tax=Nothobranchius furzeri TaxID=105023 RepID=A0A8C6Q8A1_NOTFU
MKVFVLALTVALVGESPEFVPGKTYEYKYEGHLLGGLPEEGLARAGVKIESKVLIGAVTPDSYILKVNDPVLYEYSGIWPKEDYRPATKLTSALSAQLLTPIKFEYANGVVGKVFAPAGVSEAVVNIYRGVLNILQMNIKKTQNVYELQEPGVQGVCKTHYVISEDSKDERIHITKTRDLDHCSDKVYKDIGMAAFSDRCSECRGKSLKGTGAVTYIMKPLASGTLILEATSSELIQFSPFNIVNGAAQMEAKQILKLLEVKNTPVQPVEADYLPRGSLEYEISIELLQNPIQLLRITNAEAQIVETLNQLVSLNLGKAQEESPLKYIELIQLLRVAKYETIEALWTRFKARSDYRHWMLTSIPAVANHVALKFITEKVVAGDLTNVEIAQALMTSTRLVTPDLEAVKLFESLAMTPKIQETPFLSETALLFYGSMVDKYCVQHPSCPAELVRPVHDLIVKALDRREYEQLTIILKVLGNAGHPSSLKPIMKLLPGFGSTASSLPHRVHIDAVLALRKIAKREHKMIQDIVVQIFMDKNLEPELRMVSAIVLFETKLPMGLVTTLAQNLLKESNLQVASFVYSYMKHLESQTCIIFLFDSAAACNVAIRILSPKLDRLSYRFSRAFYYDTYYNPWMLGAAASAYYINDVASVLPRTIMAKASTYFAGVHIDVLEFGVRTEGVQEALFKVRDLPEDADRITKMKQAIKALTEWRADPSRHPLGSVYIKVLGQEIAFVNVDKEIVEQIIQFATGLDVPTYGRKALDALVSGYTLKYSRPILAAEVRRILPTAIGLPMELSFYTAAVAAASVELHATVSPPLTGKFNLAQLLNSDISLKADIAPSVSMHTYAAMGVNTAFLQATVMIRAKVHSVVPKKIEARLDVNKGYFNLKFLPVEDDESVASAHIETVAIARNVEDLAEAQITPILPAVPLIRKNSTSINSVMSLPENSSASSEILSVNMRNPIINNFKLPRAFAKKFCIAAQTFGIKACTEIESRTATFIRNSPIYAISHISHSCKPRFLVICITAAGPVIERIEIEVQVGDDAAEKIIKVINLSEEEEILENKNVLMKLKKILIPGLKNSTTTSSSSSSSRSSSSRSIASSSSTSSKTSSSSSSRRRSKMVDLNDLIEITSQTSSISSSSSSSSRRSSRSSSSSSSSRSSRLSSNASSSSSSSSSMSRILQLFSKFGFLGVKLCKWNILIDHIVLMPTSLLHFQAKYLSNTLKPKVTVLIRAIRADHKNQGYQIAAYYDQETARVQVIIANLTENDNWRICADGVMLSRHKVAWGIECKQYNTTFTAETGRVGKEPAARVKMAWDRLPRGMTRYAEWLSPYLYRAAELSGVNQTRVDNEPKEIKFSVSVANETKVNLVKLFMHLESATCSPRLTQVKVLHYEVFISIIKLLNYVFFSILLFLPAECSVIKDTVDTFNNRKYKTEMPLSCYQVLAQDCTPELKFMVLLRRDQTHERNEINVKIGNIDIDIYAKDNTIMVKVNDVEIPESNLPYQHPAGSITITKKEDGIILLAPSHGLQEVFYSLIVDWMRGQTCGLCGKADGEVRQEYRTPNDRIAKNATSFSHSWVLAGKSCRDPSECYMQLESVKLEKKASLLGEEVKCYSVEPVLRCLPGCMPVRTTSVAVGYHCVSLDSNMNRSDGLSNIYEKSIDVTETAEAHLACRCTPQCT